MNFKYGLTIILGFLLQFCITIENIRKNRVIVIVDSSTFQVTHSTFFDDLIQKGYQVDFGSLNSISVRLQQFDEYLYDHMIILATQEPTGKGLTAKRVLDFFDAGNNVFMAGDIDSSKFFRQLYSEFGVEMDLLGTQLWDDFSTPNFSIDNNIIETTNQEADIRSFGGKTEYPILYRGSSLFIDPAQNERAWGILRAENTTYSYNSASNKMTNIGISNVLVAAVQGRNNARAVITGSTEMLSNNFYKRKNYSNREYVNNLLLWNFCENGLLKVDNIRHHKEGESEIPHAYTVSEQIYYYMDIYRWNATSLDWVPYIVNDHNVMVEFTMLDPYYRVPLEKKIGSPQYSANFKAPDQHGVYQFRVTYQRPGYTFFDVSTKIPVIPPKHNDYTKFALEAFPFYASVLASIFGFFIFIIFFIYTSDEEEEKSNKKQKKQ